MLRHLLASAARMSSRSLLAKSNASVYVSSLRTFADQRESTRGTPLTQKKAPTSQKRGAQNDGGDPLIASFLLLAIPIVALSMHVVLSSFQRLVERERQPNDKHMCHTEIHPEQDSPDCKAVDAAAQSTEKPALFEGVTVSFYMLRSIFTNWFRREGTDFEMGALVQVKLPHYWGKSSDFKEMCDELKRRGIDVECSEEGIRFGLSQYALKFMHDGVNKHFEKQCNCDLTPVEPFEAPSKSSCSFGIAGTLKRVERDLQLCKMDCNPKLSTSESLPVKAGDQSTKKPDPFEGATVTFVVTRPLLPSWLGRRGDASFLAGVVVKLPNFTDTADFREICDGLKRRGIDVDCSEAGLRRGLTEYALRAMQDGVKWHFEKKCADCAIPPAPKVSTESVALGEWHTQPISTSPFSLQPIV